MPWIRLIYLELSHNSILTFVLVSLGELICDITGGTTAMTVGAFATCIRSGVAVQMMPGVFDKQ
ncbi:MAG: hypothetical protein DCC55_18805 [Chloroflexi bacterium]|nr:MAG: hypothetical protein DCC55_18805 [Chloroflexota bacterium]